MRPVRNSASLPPSRGTAVAMRLVQKRYPKGTREEDAHHRLLPAVGVDSHEETAGLHLGREAGGGEAAVEESGFCSLTCMTSSYWPRRSSGNSRRSRRRAASRTSG